VRATTTLTALELSSVGLWRAHMPGTALLSAVTGHPSLRKLRCGHDKPEDDSGAAGAAFGALVAADAPALTALDISGCELGGAGLVPLFEALPRNTHLRRLNISHNNMSERVAWRLLPAVRASGWLWHLSAEERRTPWTLTRAMNLVQERAAATRQRALAARA
jgi:hypothetical protein